ncbi:MAG: FHA domain-containing protein [Planctomycetes bacterium]|nr:FHA domain-containing protein [Planctomycetota bacterium]
MARSTTGQNEAVRHPGHRDIGTPRPCRRKRRNPANTADRKRITHVEPLLDDMPDDGRFAAASTAALPLRPSNRPPMAVLCALDDGCSCEGETWRIRKSQFVIGRSGADAVIPHDRDISAQHAEIGCRWQDGCYRWYLADLDSTNGTFIRVSRIVLRSGKQIVIGSRRYQFFDAGEPVAGDDRGEPADFTLRETRDYRSLANDLRLQYTARFVDVNAGESARSYLLNEDGGDIGSDAGCCAIRIDDDPFVDPVHARVFRDSRGRYVIVDNGSFNGLWLRIRSVYLSGLSGFQLGEQRFTINIM